ncbi:hypothetical protein TL16_g06448 [Triparma laevis f. inornata]|uniref:Uncharacterized protein n=1 Tax=Triparma laevis f. inornata TaxID=1714386 RepID=A0A9W7AUW7_9STRA|nr:hypothetical protein TL16_g06448 [Triparma laevis f. inornata]
MSPLVLGSTVGKNFHGYGYWEEVDMEEERIKRKRFEEKVAAKGKEDQIKRQKIKKQIEMIESDQFGLYSNAEDENDEGDNEEVKVVVVDDNDDNSNNSNNSINSSTTSSSSPPPFPSTVVLHHEGNENKSYPFGFYNIAQSQSGRSQFVSKQVTKPAYWGTTAARRLMYLRVHATTLDKLNQKKIAKSYIWSCWPGPADLVYLDTVARDYAKDNISNNNKKELGKDSKKWGKLTAFPGTKQVPEGITAPPVHMLSPVADFARSMRVDDQIGGINPWVYGGCFNFSMPRRGCLGNLKVGSVMYFGSMEGEEMVLDTVFVVRSFYDTDNMTREEYLEVMGGARLTNQGRGRMGHGWKEFCARPCETEVEKIPKKRIYLGATHDNPVNGMYSYTVAHREVKGALLPLNLHPRPRFSKSFIKVLNSSSGKILKKFAKRPREDPELGIGVGVIEDMYEDGVKACYDEVKRQVYSSGAFPGIRVELPEPQNGLVDDVELRQAKKGAAVEEENGAIRELKRECWEEQHCKLHLLNDDADEVLQESNKFEYNGERYIVPPLGVLAGPQLKLKPYPPGSKTKHKPITLDLRDRKVRDRLIGVDKTFNRVKGKELDDNGSNSDSDGYTPF